VFDRVVSPVANRVGKYMAPLLVLLVLLGSGLPAEAKGKYIPGLAKAKQEFKKRAMSNTHQPKHIRGDLLFQLNRWRQNGKTGFPRFKNPKGYDIGHHPMKRGSINVNDLRFEHSHDNRSRPQRAKARGRRKGFVAKFF
jgi:hypothetical protein